MKTAIQIFTNEVFGEIRTCQVNNQIMFVAKDVATALGYTNTQKAIRDHVDDEDKLTERFVLSGQVRSVIIINESGLYSLILSSKLPQAKEFKRWVTSEVLPQIRKTGGYIPTRDAEGRELSGREILERADAIVGRTLQLLNEPAEDTLTATQVAKTFNMTTLDFNAVLRDMGIQYRRHGRWNLSDDLQGRGYTAERTHVSYSLKGEKKVKVYPPAPLCSERGVNRFLN
ncbi:BRO family protein [uncultured Prevotella sp.]|uniref:BRO family protein n=1 Tax=uncultured Prevotella sp. TaxID=159272 RepID=UPI0025902380|nr:BRO family protein [uncultured Prevotella sp.]